VAILCASVLGSLAFVTVQSYASVPFVPLRRGLGWHELLAEFRFDQLIPVARLGNSVPWPLVAAGASV
jgi:hypothetical protein